MNARIERFRKVPVVVSTMELTQDNLVDVATWCGGMIKNGSLIIRTLEGDETATPGYRIVEGVAGEFYPVRPDIFARTFERV